MSGQAVSRCAEDEVVEDFDREQRHDPDTSATAGHVPIVAALATCDLRHTKKRRTPRQPGGFATHADVISKRITARWAHGLQKQPGQPELPQRQSDVNSPGPPFRIYVISGMSRARVTP